MLFCPASAAVTKPSESASVALFQDYVERVPENGPPSLGVPERVSRLNDLSSPLHGSRYARARCQASAHQLQPRIAPARPGPADRGTGSRIPRRPSERASGRAGTSAGAPRLGHRTTHQRVGHVDPSPSRCTLLRRPGRGAQLPLSLKTRALPRSGSAWATSPRGRLRGRSRGARSGYGATAAWL